MRTLKEGIFNFCFITSSIRGSAHSKTSEDFSTHLFWRLFNLAIVQGSFHFISQVAGDSFDSAWKIIVSRYENKRLHIFTHMDQLFATTIISPKAAQGINSLLSSTTQSLNALATIGLPVEHWDQVLVHHITRRLDTHTREGWEVKLGAKTEPPSYAQLTDFLTGQARALESISSYSHQVKSNNAPTNSQSISLSRKAYSGLAHSTNQQGENSCSACGESHCIVKCTKFRDMTPINRRNLMIKERLCFNYLSKHSAIACRIEKRCEECKG